MERMSAKLWQQNAFTVLTLFAAASAVPQAARSSDPALISKPDAPDFESLEFQLGMKYSAPHHYKEAVHHFDAAIRRNPKCARCFYQRALAYVNLKGPDEAFADFVACQRLDPNFQINQEQFGLACQGAGKFREAVEHFSAAIVKNPKVDRLYYERAQAYYDLLDFKQTIADYSAAIKLKPTEHNYYRERASCYRRAGQFDKALADYGLDLKLFPESANTFLHRADCYFEMAKYKEALADYSKAIELKPSASRSYVARAKVYDRMGRKDLADDDRKKATEVGEDFRL